MKKILKLLFLLCFSFIFNACNLGKDSYIQKFAISNQTKTSFSCDYEYLDGTKNYTINAGKPITINIKIESVEGVLGITILNSKNETVYSETDLKTSEFKIEIKEVGRYKVQIKAQKHKGSYEFNWN